MSEGDLLAAHKDIMGQGPHDDIRSLGAQHFKSKGLPTFQDESWKYTSLKPLQQYYRWERQEHHQEKSDDLDLLPQRIVFFNGQWRPHLTVLEKGCQWGPLERKSDLAYLKSRLPKQDCFLGLAMAYYKEAYKLELSGKGQSPLGLYSFFDKNFDGMMAHPLVFIEAQEQAQWELFELTLSTEKLTSAFHNAHCLLRLHPRSDVEHVRVFKTSSGLLPFSQVLGEVTADASYRNTVLALGGSFLRNNVQVKLLEKGAQTSLNGLYSHQGKEDSSHFSLIKHQAPKTSSRQLYKGMLAGHSHACFNGTIEVGKDCPQVEAHQLNQNILLSDTATIDSRPQLEIHNSDVKCSHGSTVGQWEADKIFYLQTRGLPRPGAEKLLAKGFCEDVIFNIQQKALQKLAQTALFQSLSEGNREEGTL